MKIRFGIKHAKILPAIFLQLKALDVKNLSHTTHIKKKLFHIITV